MWSVLFGTFTLRFSTGLTGAMLTFYLADLPEHQGIIDQLFGLGGGVVVGALAFALIHASFYASELVLSPLFGILSDRHGHWRVMQYGPIFGLVAVVITWATTNLPLIVGTRLLEGSATASSIPSILGFIAVATALDEGLRGKAVARFEAATLAGLLAGFAAAGPLFTAFGAEAFLINGLVYVVSLLIYRYGVDRNPRRRQRRRTRSPGAGSTSRATGKSCASRTSGCWRRRGSPSTRCSACSPPRRSSSSCERRTRSSPTSCSWAASSHSRSASGSPSAVCCSSPASSTGATGSRTCAGRRSSCTGSAAGRSSSSPRSRSTTAAGWRTRGGSCSVSLPAGLFVLAGATPAAIGLLADVTEGYPDDRGAIMGLYSVFLGLGQIGGSLIAGVAATALGLDGILVASLVLLVLAVVPLTVLRRHEHYLAGPATPASID